MKKKQTGLDEMIFGQPTRDRATFEIRGTSPLLMNKQSDESMDEITKKQVDPKGAKVKINTQPRRIIPDEIVMGHVRQTHDRCVGFASDGFLGSLISAAQSMGYTRKDGAGFSVVSEYADVVPIAFDDVEIRKDRVVHRTGPGGGTVDNAFRPAFHGWSCLLTLDFDKERVNPKDIVNLINRAGQDIGVGSWRPYNKSATGNPGSFGRFEVAQIIEKDEDVAKKTKEIKTSSRAGLKTLMEKSSIFSREFYEKMGVPYPETEAKK